MSTHKLLLAVATLGLGACTPHLSAADLDAAQKASDAVCKCTRTPIDKWRECSVPALAEWKTADDKLRAVAPMDKLEPHAKATLESMEVATAKCKSMGEVVWASWKQMDDAKKQGLSPSLPKPAPLEPQK